MRRHLKRSLNDADLRNMGGSYEGTISAVVEEEMRNRFTTQRTVQPVIVFTDGYRIVPNIGMQRTLVESYGAETDSWVDKRIRVFRRPMTRRDSVKAQSRFAKRRSNVLTHPRRSRRRLLWPVSWQPWTFHGDER